jgi:dUTP diphosphatase
MSKREELFIKFKRTNESATIPNRANPTDVGLDLTAVDVKLVEDKEEGTYYEYDTGIAVAIPEGYGGFIFPRSSISKKDLILANAVGVIDPGYRSSIKLRFKFRTDPNIYKVGDKIAQLVILPYPDIHLTEVTELPFGERGEKGFGSSDNKSVSEEELETKK